MGDRGYNRHGPKEGHCYGPFAGGELRPHPAGALNWLCGPAVEHRSLAGVLSLSCARLVADG